MNLQTLFRAAGAQSRKALASSLVLILGVAAVLVLGHLASAQTPGSGPAPSAPTAAPQTPPTASAQGPAQKAEAPPAPATAVNAAATPAPAGHPVGGVPAPAAVPGQATAGHPARPAPPAPPSAFSSVPWPPAPQAPVTTGSTFLSRLQGVLMALALISLLVWGVLKLLAPSLPGMMSPRGGGRQRLMNVVERHALGPGKGLYLVEVAGRYLLLGMTENGINHLAELTPEEVRAATPAEPGAAPEGEAPTLPPGRNLLADVLARHLASVPGLSSRQRGS